MVRLGICATRGIRRPSWTKGLVCSRETQVKGWPHPLAQRSPLRGVPGREHAESNGGRRGMAEQARDLPRMGMLLGAELLWTPWRIHLFWEIGDHGRVFNGKVGSCCYVPNATVTSGVPWEAAIHIHRDFRSRSPMWTDILGKNKLNNPRGSCVSDEWAKISKHFLSTQWVLGILGKEFCCL